MFSSIGPPVCRPHPKLPFSSTSSRDHPQRRFSPSLLLVRLSSPSWVGVPVGGRSNTHGRDPQRRRPHRHAILTSYFLSSGGSFPPSTNRVNMSYPQVTGYGFLLDRGCLRKTIKGSVVFELGPDPSSPFLFPPQTLQTPCPSQQSVYTSPIPEPHLYYDRDPVPTKHTHQNTLPTRPHCTINTFPRPRLTVGNQPLFSSPPSTHHHRHQPSQWLPTPQRSTTPALCPCPFPAARDSIQVTIKQRAPTLSHHQRSTPR